jgi:hypothetical protein
MRQLRIDGRFFRPGTTGIPDRYARESILSLVTSFIGSRRSRAGVGGQYVNGVVSVVEGPLLDDREGLLSTSRQNLYGFGRAGAYALQCRVG